MTAIHVFGDSHVLALSQGFSVLSKTLVNEDLSVDFNSRNGLNWYEF